MRWACAALILAGCAAPALDTPRTKPIPFQFDARGVQLLDRAQRIDFGRTDHSAERAMNKLVAAAPQRRGACAGGGQYVVWSDGSLMVFDRGNFVGWTKGDARAGRACVTS